MTRDIWIAITVVIAGTVCAAVFVIRDTQPQPIAANSPPAVLELPRQVQAPPVIIQTPSPMLQGKPAPAAPATLPAALPPRREAAAALRRNVSQPMNQPITEPVARDALARVGVDPEADVVWMRAINDDNLSPQDRKNLIEDLNETGFADPRNIGPADLPVIEYRLSLIENLAPGAMDDTNYAAFQEAYKDLNNMRARLVGK